MNILNEFLKWLMPYKYIGIEHKPKHVIKDRDTVKSGALGISLVTKQERLSEQGVLNSLRNADYDVGHYFHDNSHHQVAVHFNKNSATRYRFRNDKKRRKLIPQLYPITKIAYDRTHLIPIGYHGTEMDSRLVVGWNSDQNRGPINVLEKKIEKINKKTAIIWFVSIEKTNKGAKWKERIYSEDGKKLISSDFEDQSEFYWNM